MNIKETRIDLSLDKKYLGHQHFPAGKKQITLTIENVKQETIYDPQTKQNTQKIIIYFQEKHDWVKPMICNITNRLLIEKSLNNQKIRCEALFDMIGVILDLVIAKDQGFKKYVSLNNEDIITREVKNEKVDCVRVKKAYIKKLSDELVDELLELINGIAETDNTFTLQKVLNVYSVNDLSQLTNHKAMECKQRLQEKLKNK